jgi:hypothetical protein
MKFRIGDLKLLSLDSKIRITQMKFRIADWTRGKGGAAICKYLYYKYLRHSPAPNRSQHDRLRIDFGWQGDYVEKAAPNWQFLPARPCVSAFRPMKTQNRGYCWTHPRPWRNCNGDLKMPRKPRQDRHFTYRLIFGGSRFGPVLNALRHQQSSSRYESSLSHLELGPLGEQAGGG